MYELDMRGKTAADRGYEEAGRIQEVVELFALFLRELPRMLRLDSCLENVLLKTSVGMRKLREHYYKEARRFLPYISSTRVEEIRGISYGTGGKTTFDLLLAINVFDDIGRITAARLAIGGCSAIAAPTRQQNRNWIVGCNHDYGIFTKELARLATLYRYEDAVVLGYPGFVGALMGMNRCGVVLHQLIVPTSDARFDGTPASLLFRDVLHKAKSWNHAEYLITNSVRAVANNVLVASAQRAVILEESPTAWRRIVSSDFVAATNHFTHPELKELMIERPAPPFSFSLDPHYYSNEFSQARLEFLNACARQVLPQTPVALHYVLSRPLITGKGIGNCCGNVACMIFNPEKLEYWFADNGGKVPAAEGPLVHRKL